MRPESEESIPDIRSDQIDLLAARLIPGRNRAEVFGGFDALFACGVAPDPVPSGFQPGRLLGTSTWGPWDAVVMQIARVWMPWLGKTFSPSTGTGVNRFTPTTATRVWLRTLFPRHTPQPSHDHRLEAFPFRIRIAPGELDPDVDVLKIDYDFEANPALIRHILDEVVQVSPGRLLGKVLFRTGDRFHRVGFFSLGTPLRPRP